MAIGALREFDATPEQYDAVGEKLGVTENPPEGQILHSAMDIGGGKMRVFEIWESQAALDKFGEERLMPAIVAAMGDDAAPPTLSEDHELHNLQQA
jgi:quinol monooxygenase YgiN